jgi:Mannosylglycerate hydrolase MGH1-like glycoside hydrolase domain
MRLEDYQIIPFDLLPFCPYNTPMRDWSLAPGDPLCLTLAADSRLSIPDYLNDHIWELALGGGEPPALSLRTTFGLRAKSMRLFLRFTEANKSVSDPAAFALPPTVRKFYPNFISLEYAPLPNIDVSAEYWVPQSNAVCGRITVANKSNATRKIRLDLCAILSPIDGQAMNTLQMSMVNILSGNTNGLYPVLFLTGGPAHGSGPYPSLFLNLDLGPGATRQLTWGQAATNSLQTSFDLARQTAARPWEAERARLELLNASQTIDIHTGDKDWDAAFAFSQNTAFGLFFPPNTNLPNPSSVSARGLDNGYSPKGDGTDYPASWNGQSPLEAYYLASVLPASQAAQDLLMNFLAVQNEADGTIDGKPGLAGQRGRYLATPMLTSLAWKLYEKSEDKEFLNKVFPHLLKFFWSWFSPEYDDDRDGLPQWKHVLQTGFEDNPLFDAWHAWSLGVNISQVHSPALEAMLYNESACLIKIAEQLDRHDSLVLLNEQAATLRKSIESAWQPRTGLSHYRERGTGSSLAGKILVKQQGAGTFAPKLKFESPIRLLIEVQTQSPGAKRPEIRIHQFSTKPADEIIQSGDYQWRNGGSVYTTKNVFSKIAKLVVRDLSAEDSVSISTLDFTTEDHTLFTPLWAGVFDAQQAQIMIGRALLDAGRFYRPYGVPACPLLTQPEAESVSQSVHLPWNLLISEGLLRYGFRSDAARMFVHNMTAIIQNLKQNRAFFARYHAERGTGIGERNSLSGLAPVGLFLKILGVEILSATRVKLEGENPFPWDVTIQYKGLKVIRGQQQTEVVFANGKSVIVKDTEPTVVSL